MSTSGMPVDAQQQQDRERNEWVESGKPRPKGGLRALLPQPSESTSSEASSETYDPIEAAMKQHPGLTRERAEKLAEQFGF